MFSNLSIFQPQPQPQPAATSPFFTFLADQYKAIKTQNPDIKLLDLAASAIREWDEVVNIRHEPSVQSLEEPQKNDLPVVNNVQPSISPESPSQLEKSQVTLSYDANGKPKKPLPPFFLFKEANLEQVKREHPEKKIVEITQLIGDMWKDASEDVKLLYETKAKEATELYKRELEAFKETESLNSIQAGVRRSELRREGGISGPFPMKRGLF